MWRYVFPDSIRYDLTPCSLSGSASSPRLIETDEGVAARHNQWPTGNPGGKVVIRMFCGHLQRAITARNDNGNRALDATLETMSTRQSVIALACPTDFDICGLRIMAGGRPRVKLLE